MPQVHIAPVFRYLEANNFNNKSFFLFSFFLQPPHCTALHQNTTLLSLKHPDLTGMRFLQKSVRADTDSIHRAEVLLFRSFCEFWHDSKRQPSEFENFTRIRGTTAGGTCEPGLFMFRVCWRVSVSFHLWRGGANHTFFFLFLIMKSKMIDFSI